MCQLSDGGKISSICGDISHFPPFPGQTLAPSFSSGENIAQEEGQQLLLLHVELQQGHHVCYFRLALTLQHNTCTCIWHTLNPYKAWHCRTNRRKYLHSIQLSPHNAEWVVFLVQALLESPACPSGVIVSKVVATLMFSDQQAVYHISGMTVLAVGSCGCQSCQFPYGLLCNWGGRRGV